MIFVRFYSTTPTASADNKMWVKLSSTASATSQDRLAGTWVFNNTLDFTAHNNTTLSKIPLVFVSNDTEYTVMTIGSGANSLNRRMEYGSGLAAIVYMGSSFKDVAFQTIEILTTYDELAANYANAELVLAFLQVNATKIS